MWACNLHEYYADFKSRVQNVFRKYEAGGETSFQIGLINVFPNYENGAKQLSKL